ncbi:MAG: proline dehydrogenase family protein [Acidobacteriota bacterium]
MLRNLFLFLSRQKWLRSRMERPGMAERMVRRFVAGKTLDEAVGVCRQLNNEGVLVTLDHLGENVTNTLEASASLADYQEALLRLRQERIPGTISVKLSQLGLDLSASECRERVFVLCDEAARSGTHVEIDMESSGYVDRTLEIVSAAHARTGNVRAVIQAYLRRSEGDIRRLNGEKIPVRLCKGAYLERGEAVYEEKRDVDENYERLMRLLLAEGTAPAIATHDDVLVGKALQIIQQRAMTADRMEFQMLYGIRRDLQKRIVQSGFRLRLYVPYGAAWYPYFMRRLAERPANVWFLARNLTRA